MDVVHAVERFAGKPRRVVVVDIAHLRVQHIEHVEQEAGPFRQPVPDLRFTNEDTGERIESSSISGRGPK